MKNVRTKTKFAAHVILAGCFLSGLLRLQAQVILHPNQLSGTARFNNSNPAIVNLLKAPGNEGMTNILVRADSLPPSDAISASSDYLPVTTRMEAGYQLTVDSDSAGISLGSSRLPAGARP